MSRTLPLPFSSTSTSSLRRFLRPFLLPSATTTTSLPRFSASKQLHPLNTLVFNHRTKYSKPNFSPLNALNGVVLVDETDNSDYETAEEDKAVDSVHLKSLDTRNDVVSDDFNAAEDNVKQLENVNGVVLEEDEGEVDDLDEEVESGSDDSRRKVLVVNAKISPSLGVKEKKELASYAHGLGKKLKSQQVGKSGVTDTVITALIETLEKNELLKLKIHNNCPSEMDDAITQIEMGTGSVAVSRIGRTVILYRPSISKLQAEQKKKLARRNLMKKRPAWVRSSSQSNEELPKLTARGRRGSSRV